MADLRIEELPRDALSDAAAILCAAAGDPRLATVAEEKLFGDCPPPARGWTAAAWSRGGLAGIAAGAGGWLRVLAVAPEHRGRGAGSALLDEATRRAREAGAATLRTGDQPGNYLFPGIPAKDAETIAYFERRGFRRAAENTSLLVSLECPALAPERVSASRAAAASRGYALRRAGGDDAEMRRDLASRFSPGWAFEVGLADVHVAARGDALVAFAATDGNNRGLGAFGPAGTLEEHRGRGIGEALLVAALADLAARGCPQSEIAWIGPRAFYERVLGPLEERRFVVLERDVPR